MTRDAFLFPQKRGRRGGRAAFCGVFDAGGGLAGWASWAGGAMRAGGQAA